MAAKRATDEFLVQQCAELALTRAEGYGSGGGGYGGGGGGGYGGGGRQSGTYASTRRRPTPPRSGLHMFVAGFTFITSEKVCGPIVMHAPPPPSMVAAVL